MTLNLFHLEFILKCPLILTNSSSTAKWCSFEMMLCNHPCHFNFLVLSRLSCGVTNTLCKRIQTMVQKSQYLSIDLKSSIQPLNHHSMKQSPSNLPLKKRFLQPMMMMIQHLNEMQNLPIKFEPGMTG